MTSPVEALLDGPELPDTNVAPALPGLRWILREPFGYVREGTVFSVHERP